jgi:pimeloyl-ACP methyl ester carboxylesterase
MSRHMLLLVLLTFAGGAPAHAQAPLEDKFFDSNGVRIRYVEAGRGEPVVLVHGLGDWVDGLWRNSGVIDALAKDFHVIALDCRGHGKSGKPHDPASYGREMVEDVARLLDHLQTRRAHIVGFSMGGNIAGKFSVAHPDRVLTATFGASSPLVWTGETERDLTERAESFEQGKVRNPDHNDPLALAAVVRGAQEIAVTTEEIRALSMPLLAVIGSADGSVMAPRVDAFKRLKPEVKLVVIDGAEHAGATSRPEFAAAVREFLIAHRGSTDKGR